VEIGQKVTVTVAARRLWNDTGVVLEQGRTYRFTAAGEWVDAWNRCGPDGYASNNVFLRLAEWARRDPPEPWFALIGAHAHDLSTRFAIGAGSECQPRQTGELTCFANDVPFFYWNNRGEISLTIERVA
jgi:hypothetical protein